MTPDALEVLDGRNLAEIENVAPRPDVASLRALAVRSLHTSPEIYLLPMIVSFRFLYRNPMVLLALIPVFTGVTIYDALYPQGLARRPTPEERIAQAQAKLEPQFVDSCLNMVGHSTRVCRCYGVKMAMLTAQYDAASAEVQSKQPTLVEQGKEQMSRCEALVAPPQAGRVSPQSMAPPAPQARFTSKPSAAVVTVDGVQRGVTPLALPLEAGVHEVVFAHEGRGSVKRTFEFGSEDLTIAPAGAEVWVDGVQVSGVTPLTVEVTSGQAHTLMAAKAGLLPGSTTVTALQAADFTERNLTLRSAAKAQLKTCAAQAVARAGALEKKGAALEAAAKRAEAQWCDAQLTPRR